MNISKAEEVLKDLVDSTSRMDGRPLKYTSEEFEEAYGEFVKRINAVRITNDDLKRLAEGSAELTKHVEAARIGYKDLERLAEASVKLAKNAQIAASKLIDVASMYPVGINEKVNCTDDSCIYPISCAEDVVMLKNMNGDIVGKLSKGGNEDGLHKDE